MGKPGKNGNPGGRSAGGDSLDGLIENVRGVQAEDGNLIAAGVGDDREIIDFVDGDASRSRGSAGAGEQGNFLEDGEIRDVRTGAGTSDHIESEVARARKDVERAARRAGIRRGHGNGDVHFAAAHKGESGWRS